MMNIIMFRSYLVYFMIYSFISLLHCTSPKDNLSSTTGYIDIDLFLSAMVMLDNNDEDRKHFIDRPCFLALPELRKQADVLFQQMGITRFDFSGENQTTTSNSGFQDHINMLKEKVNDDNRRKMKIFISEHFCKVGEEVVSEKCELLNMPSNLEQEINDSELLDFVKALHHRWTHLYKKYVKVGKTTTSIFLPHPFVVPGGRFQEFYYWDTWFVLEGLITAGLKEMALNVVKNCMFLIKELGFIPNGTRKYYTNRSQPPFFCSMLMSLLRFEDEKINKLVLTEGLEMALREIEFFEKNKQVTFEFEGENETMFRYYVNTDYPRLESLLDDFQTFEKAREKYPDKEELQYEIYSSIKSAAESGIDFSTRWFSDQKYIESIETIYQIPVDLNALMYKNYTCISKFFKMKEDKVKSNMFAEKAKELGQKMNRILWNKEQKCWNDWNFKRSKYVDFCFFPSNFFPLFFGVKPPSETAFHLISRYKKEIFDGVGGIAATGSEVHTENLDVGTNGEVIPQEQQQWDHPNVWAPHIYLFFEYFSNDLQEEEMAYHVAKTFFDSVYVNFKQTGIFYEKYKVSDNSKVGSGGEYKNQEGFGWTNGVTICFLKKYGDQLMKDFNAKHSKSHISHLLSQRLGELEQTKFMTESSRDSTAPQKEMISSK